MDCEASASQSDCGNTATGSMAVGKKMTANRCDRQKFIFKIGQGVFILERDEDGFSIDNFA
jgi:hypothetical protein